MASSVDTSAPPAAESAADGAAEAGAAEAAEADGAAAAKAGVSVFAALLGGMPCSAPRPRPAPARCAAETDVDGCCSDDMAGQAAGKAWA